LPKIELARQQSADFEVWVHNSDANTFASRVEIEILYMNKTTTTTLALVALVLACASLPCGDEGVLMRGIDAYRTKDYRSAQILLRQAVSAAPEDSVAHYYLGNTLLKLKNPSAARLEYQSASADAETDDIKNNSQTALQLLRQPATQTLKTVANSRVAAPRSSLLDSLPFMADERKLLTPYLKDTENLSANKTPIPNELQKFGSQDSALPNFLADLLGKTNFGTNMTPAERQAFVEKELQHRSVPLQTILNSGDDKKSSLLKGTPNSNLKSDTIAEERAKSLKEVQSNLDDQINSKVGNSSVHLKSEGTSLYIRNYSHD
jgi:hypothetical protein